MKTISSKRCRENQNTRFMFNNFVFENVAFWDIVEIYCRAGQATNDNIIWRMRSACWILKATLIHSHYTGTHNYCHIKLIYHSAFKYVIRIALSPSDVVRQNFLKYGLTNVIFCLTLAACFKNG